MTGENPEVHIEACDGPWPLYMYQLHRPIRAGVPNMEKAAKSYMIVPGLSQDRYINADS
jgi:hypothetical protein